MWRYFILGTVFGAGLMSMFLAPVAAGILSYNQLDLFGEAFERVRADYVHEVSDSTLIEHAISGMMSALDPHSSYIDPESLAEMQRPAAGIGLELENRQGAIVVVAPVEGSPAESAGIRSGDVIRSIAGKSADRLDLNQAVMLMRGEANSTLSLTLERPGETISRLFNIVRAPVHVFNVTSSRKGDAGYLRIHSFNEETESAIESAVKQMRKQAGPQLKGFVLDLRNNSGGLFDQTIDVTDDFLNSGTIVTVKGRTPENNQAYEAKPGDITDGAPLIVLINARTSGGAEILASALQDNHRATVLGERSFGLGMVRTIIPLNNSDSGALNLTTGEYFRPSGAPIELQGVTPDTVVSPISEAQAKVALPARREADIVDQSATDVTHTETTGSAVYPDAGKQYDDFQLSYAIARLDEK